MTQIEGLAEGQESAAFSVWCREHDKPDTDESWEEFVKDFPRWSRS